MEVKFNKIQLPCLRPVVSQCISREETLELRLPDGMPDIGKVLGCWGQIVVRGKEWHDTSAWANAGVMVWVLYGPEDGTEPRVVEGWIPVQGRWELPEESRDGMLTVQPWLSGLDGRNVSARKLMLRAEVSMMGSAMKPWKGEIAAPADIPEDIRLLKKTYPMELPAEQGEKQVTLEETIPLSSVNGSIHRIVSYQMTPAITEYKVLANRLVFKGSVALHLVYLSENGSIHVWDTELPFSQYTELDKDYDPSAKAWVMPVLTASELDMVDGDLMVKAGIAVQYTIFHQTSVEVVEDAYSPRRQINPEREALYLPSRLDSRMISVPVQGSADGDFTKILDTSFIVQLPIVSTGENGQEMAVRGQSQLLYRDGEHKLCSDIANWNGRTAFEVDSNTRMEIWPGMEMNLNAVPNGEDCSIRGEMTMTVNVYGGEPIPMVVGMEMGEVTEPDPNRPSVILRRAGEADLWEMAKQTGSTVEEICRVNHLSGEPEAGKMLLIPIP